MVRINLAAEVNLWCDLQRVGWQNHHVHISDFECNPLISRIFLDIRYWMQRKEKEKITQLGFRRAIHNPRKFLKAWAKILAADNPKAKSKKEKKELIQLEELKTHVGGWIYKNSKPVAPCSNA